MDIYDVLNDKKMITSCYNLEMFMPWFTTCSCSVAKISTTKKPADGFPSGFVINNNNEPSTTPRYARADCVWAAYPRVGAAFGLDNDRALDSINKVTGILRLSTRGVPALLLVENRSWGNIEWVQNDRVARTNQNAAFTAHAQLKANPRGSLLSVWILCLWLLGLYFH